MVKNKRFFKALRFAHWHVKLPIAARLPMVISFWWEQTCENVISVKNNVIRKIKRQLKHVKAWLKPNLHKIRKTVITLPGFGIIFAELAA